MKFLHGNILDQLKNIDDDSVDLIFTSPPYWKGFEYESYFNSYLQYINWCKKWTRDIKTKLKKDGFFLLNIANDTQTTIKAYEIMNICIENGWKLHDTVIWYVYNRQPYSTKRQLTNQYEFIFVFRHNSNNVVINKDRVKGLKAFDTKNVGNVWKISFNGHNKKSLKKVTTKHKWGSSGFPPLLCEIVLKLFSNEEDTVLDCFAGMFLLGEIGEKLNRKMIGIDKNGVI